MRFAQFHAERSVSISFLIVMAATLSGGGAPGDMPLQVGMGEACDREAFAEGACQVAEVDFRRIQGVVFHRPVADGLEIAVAEIGECDLRRSAIPNSASGGLPSWGRKVTMSMPEGRVSSRCLSRRRRYS